MKPLKPYIVMAYCLIFLFVLTACTRQEPPMNDIKDITDEISDEILDELDKDKDIRDDDSGVASDMDNNQNVNVDIDHRDDDDDILDDDDYLIPSPRAEEIIKDLSNQTIQALKNKDMDTLSQLVDPKKGVRFTPYTFVSLERDLIFNQEGIKNFFKDDKEYIWGYYDGSGEEIKLTPSEYYEEFVYSKDFANADEIGYNKVLSFGNNLENQFDVYDDPIIVEYYFPGFEEQYEGLDWQSLRLVFEEEDDKWFLVGIIHNRMTI